jgi:hypothetical protein
VCGGFTTRVSSYNELEAAKIAACKTRGAAKLARKKTRELIIIQQQKLLEK